MDKRAALQGMIAAMRHELNSTAAASRDAAAYATDEEAKAREKYETQGLEASYLARGQAAHAEEIAQAIVSLEAMLSGESKPSETVGLGSLVHVSLGGGEEWFLIGKLGGGEVIPFDGHELTLITPHSPVATAMDGLPAGSEFQLPNGLRGEVLSVH
ncbi:MAG: hypothetical protein ACFB21_11105 [Opitutales bacterium]